MLDCLISLVQEIGKWILSQCLWPPIKAHVDYWWCFHDNIQQLRDGIDKLEQKKSSIEQEIVRPRRLNHIPCPDVDTWLNATTEKLEKARRILPDDNIPKAWDILSRYSLGKNAKETAGEITKLLSDGDAIRIAMASPPHISSMDFESRKGIEEDIIKSLKESSVSMVGICGMAVVGKTTMAKRIWKRMKDENVVDEVVMVTVSQKIDIPKIQEEIAEWLKLKFDDATLVSTRAAKLRTRLMDTKRKIIILDDVWESLRFDDLGIPIESNFKGCKVLFTSRSREACKEIKNKEVFELEILGEEEAWNLFREKAGDCVENLVLNPVAKEVVAECKGLPIALVTVGLALRDKMNIRKWKDSLSQLRKSNPTDFSEVLRHVYKPLKLSYDCLDNDTERNLFLLCCLFPEDFKIFVDDLTWYSIGLGLLDDINNIEEARNRTHTLIEKLESRFLLIAVEKDRKNTRVEMHDIIRDVAIYIGSKEKNGFLKSLTSIENSSDMNCNPYRNWMSVDISMEVPVLSLFPKLRLLMLQKSKSSSTQLSDISFEGMKELNVLSFESASMSFESASIGSLPPTLGSLENLQTLCLFYCQVQNISVIGKLTSLKILNCYGCAKITELPEEIRSLSGLRLLELSHCQLLQTIPFGVISSLRRLEELKMRGSFRRWEAEENGKEKRNASLTELGSLPNLSCLEIEIDDFTLSAQEICLSLNLVKYYIRIGSDDYYGFETRDDEKVTILNLPNRIGAVGKWIQRQVRNTEGLYLEGDGCGSNNFNIAESENLRNLRVRNCSTFNKLVETKDCKFYNLKTIEITSCPELKSLFSVSAARRCLLQLEVLQITNCKSMEQVFWNEMRDYNTDGCIEFPKLKELTHGKLRNLTAFCQGLEKKDVSFCNLKSIQIFRCDNLRSLFSMSGSRRCLLQLEVLEIQNCDKLEVVFGYEMRDDNTDGCIEFPKLKDLTLRNLPNLTAFCQGLEKKVVSFYNLKSIQIARCDNLRSLFPVSTARRCLLQLEVLKITNCKSMEQVFWNELRDDNSDGCIEFPKLKELTLWNLQNLTVFCQGLEKKDVSFCNLKSLQIVGCDNLRSLFSVSVARTSLLQLEVLEIRDCESMEQVFWNEGADDNTDGCIEFPKLKELRLWKLKFWELFWNEGTNDDNTDGCIEFPKLKELRLWKLPNLTAFCQGLEKNDVSFCNLKSIDIRSCLNLRSLFSVSVARRCLLQLEVLCIRHCGSMEQVFWNEIADDNTDGCIEFPKLKELTLWNLPNLTAFCHGLENIIIKFPNLTVMDIGGLPKLNSLSPLNSETVNHTTSSHHFVCNPKVEMGCLKDLTLSNLRLGYNIRNIWCHQIPNTVFNNLEKLYIYAMHDIRSLMSTSIVKNLVSLKFLSIGDCREMVEVIEREDVDDDKQVVDANSLFPNLETLKIWYAHKLRRFWQWNHAMELPLLKYVDIDDCPLFETFTLGSINMPNMREIVVNGKKIDNEKDLNDVIIFGLR